MNWYSDADIYPIYTTAVFSLNFNSAGKGPFTAGKAKNMHHRGIRFRGQARGGRIHWFRVDERPICAGWGWGKGITSVSQSGEGYVIAEVKFFISSPSLVSAVNRMAAWVYCFRRSIRTSHEFNPLNSIILRRSETGLRHVQSFAVFHGEVFLTRNIDNNCRN